MPKKLNLLEINDSFYNLLLGLKKAIGLPMHCEDATDCDQAPGGTN